MTKKGVIWLSILLGLLVLTGVLFGAVFCLRTQNVTILGDGKIGYSKEAIIKTAGIENGKSIFLIDKDNAIKRIEETYPDIKVVQIKTTSITEIDIQIRLRHEMFYHKIEKNYYILDEDLKVLRITNEDDVGFVEPTDLIKIDDGLKKISISTKICDFVGTITQQNATRNLYIAMVSAVTKTDGTNTVYFNREDVRSAIKIIKFEEFDTFNKILIETNEGVILDIEAPETDMTHKINVCYATIKKFVEEGNDKEKSGTIRIYYDTNGNQKNVYIPANQE